MRDLLEALDRTVLRLEARWLPPSPADTATRFGYEPLSAREFLAGIAGALEAGACGRFLDVGCGIGTKVAFMWALGFDATGLDRHEPYIAAARELVPEATFTVADAFEVQEFEADLVYLYRPMVSDADQERLERHVAERLRPGTLLFLPARHPAFLGQPLAPHVWRLG